MADEAAPEGPDFTLGVDPTAIPDDGVLAGRVGDAPVLLSRVDGEFHAIGARCTHYGAPLEEGLRVGATVRCPWHHACFDLRTGAALEAPALSPADRWKVEEADGRVFVKEQQAAEPRRPRLSPQGPARVVVVGGGAAGFAAAQRLRDLGYDKDLIMVSAEAAAPCDRPNLSKDYLAGKADPAWMPLKDEDVYAEAAIDLRLRTPVARLDLAAGTLALAGGEGLAFDALLIATGAEPKRPDLPGLGRDNVFTLRTQADADAIIAAASGARRALVLGAGFIGLEVAASLIGRGLEVGVVAPDDLPLASRLGDAFGRAILNLHQSHGVRFHLGASATAFDGHRLTLEDGSTVAGDLLVVGTGVRPRDELATAAGLDTDDGIVVDARLRVQRAGAAQPGVFAAGDVARFPDPGGAGPIRVEHWVVAERHGQIAAANILGLAEPLAEPPFFWSAHYDDSIHYLGHASSWDRVDIDGDLMARDATVRYFVGERLAAAATIGRDHEALVIRREMTERMARR